MAHQVRHHVRRTVEVALQRPLQRATQIGGLLVDQIVPAGLQHQRIRGRRERTEEQKMAVLGLGLLRLQTKLLKSLCADRLEKRPTLGDFGRHRRDQSLCLQRVQQPMHLALVPPRSRDRVRAHGRKATGEYRQPPQQPPLPSLEQLIAPIKRGTHRVMVGRTAVRRQCCPTDPGASVPRPPRRAQSADARGR